MSGLVTRAVRARDRRDATRRTIFAESVSPHPMGLWHWLCRAVCTPHVDAPSEANGRRRQVYRTMKQLVPRSETVSEYLIDAVFRGGTRVAFIPRGQGLLRSLGVRRLPPGLELIPAPHEAGAALMADGYARVSGEVGLCLTSGGGAMSAAAGVLGAQADGCPLLVLVGNLAESPPLTDPAQARGFDGLSTLRGVTGFCDQVTEPAAAASALERAWGTLRGCRPGAAVLGLPCEVGRMPAPSTAFAPTTSSRPGASQACWESLFEELLSAERPLLYLGSGSRRALHDPTLQAAAPDRYQALLTVVERHALPVLTSPRAKGLFPETHEFSLGSDGPHGNCWSQRYRRAGVDSCLVVGSGLGERLTLLGDGELEADGLVRVDVDPLAARHPAGKGIVVQAEAAEFLDAFMHHAEQRAPSPSVAPRRSFLREQVRQAPSWNDDAARCALSTPLSPERVMSELQAVLNHHARCRRGVNLFCDGGDVLGWASQHLVLETPHRFWCNIRRGALGWAGAAVIGGKLAQTAVPALAVLRTRALLASGSELEVAVRRGVGAVWLVLAEPWSDDTRAAGESYDPDRGARAQRSALLDLLGSLALRWSEVHEPGVLVRELGAALEGADAGKPQVLVVPVRGGLSGPTANV